MMNRRKFLSVSMVAVVVAPASLSAVDFRATKPKAWKAHTVADAIKELYGDVKLEESNVKVGAPKVASNGGAVPISIKSDIAAKTVALFQNVNPEAAVAVYTMTEFSLVDFSTKIKMKSTGKVTAVVEGKDGKFYTASKSIEVALGGCEG